jgi:hypothetical protein
MQKTSSTAAYVAWILALVAILMPPTLASAGTELLVDAREALYELLEDKPEGLVIAYRRPADSGWQA